MIAPHRQTCLKVHRIVVLEGSVAAALCRKNTDLPGLVGLGLAEAGTKAECPGLELVWLGSYEESCRSIHQLMLFVFSSFS